MAAATAGAPQGTDATISAEEDSFRLLSGADFGFVDPDGAGSLYGVIITGMTGGTLYYDADGAAGSAPPVAISHLPRTFTVDELANGNVAWRADANVNGSGVGSITFQVIDDEGALDDSANTLIIDVTPVNDAPTLSASTDQFVDFVEDAGPVALMRNVVLGDPDMPADFAGGSLRLQAIVPDGGILLRSGSNFLVNDLGGGNFEIAYQDGAAQVVLGTINGYGSLDLAITDFTALASLTLLNDLIDDFVYANASDTPTPYIDKVVLTISEGDTGEGGALTAVQIQGLRVIPQNDAPVAEDDLVTALEDRAVTFTAGELLNNDFDPDNDQLHISSVTAVSGGRVALIAGGSVVFTPDPDFNGTASFIYVVDDGHGGVDLGEVTVGVADVYDRPALAGVVSSVNLYENMAPVLLDADVNFTASEGHIAGGTLSISGLFGEDRVAIRDQGTDPGMIGVSGAEIAYGGIVIGSFAGGLGGTFTVTFNAGATVAAIDALIENLTYFNVSDFPTSSHSLLLNFTDSDGADIGPAAVPATFTALAGAANPFFGLDLGSFSAPTFVDLDGDGDMDMVVGDNDTDFGSILGPRSFRNDGGAFTELTGGANPFDGLRGLYYAAPAFVDLDGDGDLDAVFGSRDGNLRVFANQGGGFSELTGAANTFLGLNIGFNSVPGFADLDGDGDLDLVLGVRQGSVRAFQSDGGKFRTDVGTFLQITGGNPILNLDVGYNSTPDFVDLDGDGDMDAVIGAQNGTLRTFRNDGGAFHELTGSANPFQGVDVGLGSNPGFGDLDGDGDMDVVIGAGDGSLRSFMNNMPHGRFIAVNVAAVNDVPLAGDDVLAAFEDRVATLAASDLLGNDADVDGDSLIIASVTAGTGGSVTLNDDGSITFTPDPNFNGPASFAYVISDGHGGTDEGAVIVNVAAVNDAPSLAGFEPSAILAENGAPALLDADVSFTDLEGNFDGGTLTVTGLLAEDRVAVRDQGSGSGEIGLSGSDVLYGGEIIGSFSGGVGAPLTVTFNASATSAAVEALIENLTYANGSDTPTASRTLLLNVTDADGADLGTANVPATFVELAGAANPFDGVDAGDMARPAFLDIDGDGDLDAILGRGDGGFLAFRNDGGTFTPLTGAANPLGAIYVGFVSAPGFGDLDGDGDMDALVGDADGELFAYRNDSGVFTALSGAANPFDGFYIGIYPNPAFGDLDSDGDLDVLAGGFDGALRTFANDGGVFTLLSGAANPFDGVDVGFLAAPGFVDLDGDGDLDVVIGEDGGTLHAFRNDGGVFTELAGAANPFDGVLLDGAPSPTFGDLDGDGDMDAVVGTQDGTLRAFENTSPRGAAIIVNVEAVNDAPELTGLAAAATFDKILVNTAPQLLDTDVTLSDPDSDLEGGFHGGMLTVTGLLSEDKVAIRDQGNAEGQIGVSGSNVTYGGNLIGTVTGGDGDSLIVTFNGDASVRAIEAVIENLTYANVSDNPTANRTLLINVSDATGADLSVPPSFAQLTGSANPFADANIGSDATPGFADLDGDGDMDAVVGTTDGTLQTFRNDGGVFTELTGGANPFDGVNVGGFSAPGFVDLDGDGDMDAVVGDFSGTLSAFRNNGDGSFTELVGAANPFEGVDLDNFSTPSFADLDGDGDMDAVVGENSGNLSTFRNDGDGRFIALSGTENPFNNVNFGAFAAPGFIDLDGDGDMDIVVGAGDGTLNALRNDGGVFTALSGAANPFDGVDVGLYSTPGFADLDGDGDMEAVVGGSGGTLQAFDNLTSRGQAISVAVTTQNEAPTLADFAANAAFLENDVNVEPALLDTDVTFGDPEGNFSGGSLSVTGLLAEDRVAVRDQGDEAGEIGVSGDQISYGGTVIGSVTGGAGDPLTIIFNAAATSVAIDALIENLTYANVSDTPAESRTLILEIMDGGGAAVGSAIEVEVAAQDDPPVLADVAATLAYTENDAPTAVSNALTLTDPDSANLEGATVEIRAGLISEDLLTVNGAPSGTSGAISWVYDSPSGTLILTGSAPLADYQALLRQVAFESGSDAPGASREIVWTTYDGEDVSAPQTTIVTVTELNDAPFVDLDFLINPSTGTTVDYMEGDPPLQIAPRVIIFDPDQPADYDGYSVTAGFFANGTSDDQLSIVGTGTGPGEISIIGNDLYYESVLVGSFSGGSGGTALSLVFNADACACAVELATASIFYSNDSDEPSTLDRIILFSVSDGAASDSTSFAFATIHVAAFDDAPELTGLAASATFAEDLVNAAPQLLDADVTLSDVEGVFAGGLLTVSGLLPEDVVAIRDQGNAAGQIGLSGSDVTYGGTIIGTVTGGEGDTLGVHFNADATTQAVEALLENLVYANSSDSPTASRTLLVNVVDGGGADLGSSGATMGAGHFTALSAGAGPFDGVSVFGYSAPASFDLDGDGDLDLVVGDDNGFLHAYETDAGVFTELTGGANIFDGLVLEGAATPAFADIDGDGDLDLVVGGESGGLQLFDNDGGVFVARTGVDNVLASIDVGDYSAPAFVDLDGDGDSDLVVGGADGSLSAFENHGGAFTELAGPANIFAGLGLGDYAAPTFVDLDGDGDMDLVVGNEDGVLRAFENDGGAFTALDGADNPFAGVSPVSFATPSFFDFDGDGDLDAVVGQEDGALRALENGPAHGRLIIVNVTAVDDPALARNDGFSTNEATLLNGNLFESNGSGADSDVDGPLSVAAVNGDAGAVGNQITLASGALLTVNADGTFGYDPNHAFDATPAAGSGASNILAPDNFTYTLTGGGTATVSVTIEGLDSNDMLLGTSGADVLIGGTGADTMFGGQGNDIYIVDNAGDAVLDSAGFDTIYTSLGYTLGADLERLGVNGFTTTYDINLTGNGLDNELWGNDGVNVLNGDAGADILRGFAGDDIYIVDNAGDVVVDSAGFDTIYTSVGYTLDSTVERLGVNGFTTTYDIDLTGNGLDNELWGNDGRNLLDGGAGADILRGFGGDDIYFVDNIGDVAIDSGGFDLIYTSVSYTLDSTVERLGVNGFTTTYAIDLTGNELANELWGNDGVNVLDGGLGGDILHGNGAADTFAFTAALGDGNVDQLVDFQAGVDTIALDDAVFGGLPLGALGAGAFRIGAGAQDADDRIVYDQATGALYFDADGSGAGAAVQFATLHEGLALSASDFTVI